MLFTQCCVFLLEGGLSRAALGTVQGPSAQCLHGGPSLPVLSPPSASQTEYIPLHVSGKSLTVTEERETIQQSLNRYQGHPLPHPCPGASGMGLRLGLPPLSRSSQCLTGKYVSLRCTSKELAGSQPRVGPLLGLMSTFPPFSAQGWANGVSFSKFSG